MLAIPDRGEGGARRVPKSAPTYPRPKRGRNTAIHEVIEERPERYAFGKRHSNFAESGCQNCCVDRRQHMLQDEGDAVNGRRRPQADGRRPWTIKRPNKGFGIHGQRQNSVHVRVGSALVKVKYGAQGREF